MQNPVKSPRLTTIFFISNWGRVSALTLAFVSKIFRAQNCLTVAKLFDQIKTFKCTLVDYD